MFANKFQKSKSEQFGAFIRQQSESKISMKKSVSLGFELDRIIEIQKNITAT